MGDGAGSVVNTLLSLTLMLSWPGQRCFSKPLELGTRSRVDVSLLLSPSLDQAVMGNLLSLVLAAGGGTQGVSGTKLSCGGVWGADSGSSPSRLFKSYQPGRATTASCHCFPLGN